MADENLAWEEYRTVQEKIDKIGEFGFQVKAWTAALSTATLYTGLTSEVSDWAPLLAVVIILPLWLLDEHQRMLQRILGARARVLEEALLIRASASSYDGPQIAHILARDLNASAKTKSGKLLRSSTLIFYLSMIMLSFIASVMKVTSNAAPAARASNRGNIATPP